MKLSHFFVVVMSIISCSINAFPQKAQQVIEKVSEKDNVKILFDSSGYEFKKNEIDAISDIIFKGARKVRSLLPVLKDPISVNVKTIDRNLDIVGGVFGRAEAPGVVTFNLSTASKGGVLGSANAALMSSVFHELHHLAMGWTMIDNKYGNPAGIPIATVNEGLASVFAETYTDQYFAKAADYPSDVHSWLSEIMALPIDANYSHWVSGFHPDGRSVIGYRLGRYVVHKAQQESHKDILQLSQMSPQEILSIVNK